MKMKGAVGLGWTGQRRLLGVLILVVTLTASPPPPPTWTGRCADLERLAQRRSPDPTATHGPAITALDADRDRVLRWEHAPAVGWVQGWGWPGVGAGVARLDGGGGSELEDDDDDELPEVVFTPPQSRVRFNVSLRLPFQVLLGGPPSVPRSVSRPPAPLPFTPPSLSRALSLTSMVCRSSWEVARGSKSGRRKAYAGKNIERSVAPTLIH